MIAFGLGSVTRGVHATLDGLRSHYMSLEVFWDILWTLHLGSHDSVVTTLGPFVKWP